MGTLTVRHTTLLRTSIPYAIMETNRTESSRRGRNCHRPTTKHVTNPQSAPVPAGSEQICRQGMFVAAVGFGGARWVICLPVVICHFVCEFRVLLQKEEGNLWACVQPFSLSFSLAGGSITLVWHYICNATYGFWQHFFEVVPICPFQKLTRLILSRSRHKKWQPRNVITP